MPSMDKKGSIPARAGEPRVRGAGPVRPGVYPRACGGTRLGGGTPISAACLSPRVRGNLLVVLKAEPVSLSIPARAGEPSALLGYWERVRTRTSP